MRTPRLAGDDRVARSKGWTTMGFLRRLLGGAPAPLRAPRCLEAKANLDGGALRPVAEFRQPLDSGCTGAVVSRNAPARA